MYIFFFYFPLFLSDFEGFYDRSVGKEKRGLWTKEHGKTISAIFSVSVKKSVKKGISAVRITLDFNAGILSKLVCR